MKPTTRRRAVANLSLPVLRLFRFLPPVRRRLAHHQWCAAMLARIAELQQRLLKAEEEHRHLLAASAATGAIAEAIAMTELTREDFERHWRPLEDTYHGGVALRDFLPDAVEMLTQMRQDIANGDIDAFDAEVAAHAEESVTKLRAVLRAAHHEVGNDAG